MEEQDRAEVDGLLLRQKRREVALAKAKLEMLCLGCFFLVASDLTNMGAGCVHLYLNLMLVGLLFKCSSLWTGSKASTVLLMQLFITSDKR